MSVIRVELNNLFRATAVSLVLACGGASFLGASAQIAVDETPAAKAPAKTPTMKAAQTKALPAMTAEPKATLAGTQAAQRITDAKNPASKSAETKTADAKNAKPKTPPAIKVVDELNVSQRISEGIFDLAGWIISSEDNRGLPFAIIDKEAAQILVYSADGKIRGVAPVLVGSAVGDGSAPGVGDRELKDIPAEDRTTPAGRYLAAFGPAAGGKKVLWIDFATSISIHAIPQTTASVKEKRKQRLASKTADDNRISHGCINVSPSFYTKIIQPLFKKTGVFYVLPDSEPVIAAFPGFQQPTLVAASDNTGD